MAAYVIGSGVQYGTYLQAQSFVNELKATQLTSSRAMTAAVRTSTADLLASQGVLQSQNVRLTEATEDGFRQLSWDIQAATGAIQELDATFVWGFNAILSHTGRMADALEDLLAATKSPTKTRAYEYFDDARTAFRRGHLPDALELVGKAISGDHTSAGYKLEWRFHMLRGAVLVGAFSNPELLDLQAAEQSYLSAAGYARTEDPDGAALALLGLGWACYCQGRLEDALTHTNNAVSFCPSMGEAHYQSAKVLMAMGRNIDGLKRLHTAADSDPQYVLKAATDGDFQRVTDEFEDWCRRERDDALEALRKLYDDESPQVQFWHRCLQCKVDLALLAAVMLEQSSPLVDTLAVLHAVRSIAPTNAQTTSFTAADALRAIDAVPARLQIPPQLLGSCRNQAVKWPFEPQFFALGLRLLARHEASTAEAVCLAVVGRDQKPLEFFALLFDSAGTRHLATLASDLKLRQAGSRIKLIDEFEAIVKSGRYSKKTLEAIRDGLSAQYATWRAEIDKELRTRALAGTEHPLNGAVGRFVGSFFGMMIPGLIAEAAVSTGLAFVVWGGGILFVVGFGIVNRTEIRDARLRDHTESEKQRRAKLDIVV